MFLTIETSPVREPAAVFAKPYSTLQLDRIPVVAVAGAGHALKNFFLLEPDVVAVCLAVLMLSVFLDIGRAAPAFFLDCTRQRLKNHGLSSWEASRQYLRYGPLVKFPGLAGSGSISRALINAGHEKKKTYDAFELAHIVKMDVVGPELWA